MPTPHPGNSQWARERLDALAALYRPTPAGEALLRSLDLRQMAGEPGFFGSYGFGKWAGAGEAKPIDIMHELGHSYWGGFPVQDRPDLSWEPPAEGGLAPAMAAYHSDILTFMSQPPDGYELLRQRLRSLPGLSSRNTEPLFHSLEADIPYITGGDISLVPPILRKYWTLFLREGPFGSWERAAGWYQSLPPEDRRTAGKFLGFEHFDLRQYTHLNSPPPSFDLLPLASSVLAREERQRLTDLAEQFDSLLGDAQLEEDFTFWRGYLRDKVALHRSHPEHLASLGNPRAEDIAKALAFLTNLDGTSEAKARVLEEQIRLHPFLVNFLPAVDDGTLVELFAPGIVLPDSPTLQATASFVQRLQRFGAVADRVLSQGRRSAPEGADTLRQALEDAGLDNAQDIRLFLGLLHGSDRALARAIFGEIDNETIQALMAPAPVHMRNILGPELLLRKLDVTATATEEALLTGLALLINESSGNYRIDEPFLELLYEVMAERISRAPTAALAVMSEPHFPVEGMLLKQPEAAAAAFFSDAGRSLEIVKSGDPVLAPPARLVYRLISASPQLAAELLVALDQHGERQIATESLVYLAYDKSRSEKFPKLPISLESNGQFLASLMEKKGAAWLESRMTDAVAKYRRGISETEVSPDFLARYKETLLASAETTGAETESRLAAIVRNAFGD